MSEMSKEDARRHRVVNLLKRIDPAGETLKQWAVRRLLDWQPGPKVNHFFDTDVVDEKEAEAAARIAAERAYTQRLMSVPVDVLKSGEKWSMDQWWPRI